MRRCLLLLLLATALAADPAAAAVDKGVDAAAPDSTGAVPDAGEADGSEAGAAADEVEGSEDAAAAEAAAEEPAPAPEPIAPPAAPRSKAKTAKKSSRTAVRGGLLSTMSAKAKAVGVPAPVAPFAVPAVLLAIALGAAGVLGLGSGAATVAVVNAALAAEEEPMEELAAPPKFESTSDLWLDRQIDKVIDALKGVVGR